MASVDVAIASLLNPICFMNIPSNIADADH
jgi:hypothetical protein